METEFEMKKPCCPVVDINGQIANGKQFDLDITIPEDHRNVIYGVVKNCFKEPIEDAVVKLIEVDKKVAEKKESQFLTHLQINMVSLYLDLFVQIKNMP